jgi:hypothetical protein
MMKICFQRLITGDPHVRPKRKYFALSGLMLIFLGACVYSFLVTIRLLWSSVPATPVEISDQPTNVQSNLNKISDQPTNVQSNLNKIILVGPHDRFNFGDLLFEKVAIHLLTHRAGFQENQLISAGMISTNMSKYGGNPDIRSVKDAVEMSHMAVRDFGQHPFDIVFLGGESLGCDHNCGKRMLDKRAFAASAIRANISNCAYLIPKEMLVPPSYSGKARTPVAIVNSVGKDSADRGPCVSAVATADYIAFRDLEPNTTHPTYLHAQLRPDSAVMVRELFQGTIVEHIKEGQVARIRHATHQQKYIAVQMKQNNGLKPQRVAEILDKIWQSTNFTTVFFRAGSVRGHDSLGFYTRVASKMKSPYIIFEEEHVWSVVGLILEAAAVLGSSLHVRIMSFIYEKPRVTLCSEIKHQHFIQYWEAPDAAPCIAFSAVHNVVSAVEAALQMKTMQTEIAVNKAVQAYLEGFDEWSALLKRQKVVSDSLHN